MSLRRTPLKRKSDKARKSDKLKKEEVVKMQKWFREIWDDREDQEGFCYCFETGARMDPRLYRDNSACYDHVLEKNNGAYPQYKFVKKNIIIILPEVHYQKGSNIDKCPRIKEYKEKLLSLHYNDELKD